MYHISFDEPNNCYIQNDMIEGVCVCWERFKSGEIDLSELIDQLDGIESTHHDWPPALIVNLVQHLESAFDQGNTDQAHLGLIV